MRHVVLLLVLLFLSNTAYAQQLRLIEPNGGERYAVGDSITFRWDGVAADVPVSIEYSIDNGVEWTSAADGVTGGSFRWKVPNRITAQVMARIWTRPQNRWELVTTIHHTVRIREARFIAGGKILSVDEDTLFTIWKGDGSARLHRLGIPGRGSWDRSHRAVWSAAPSPDGRIIADALTTDTLVLLWDTETGSLIRSLPKGTIGIAGRGIVPERFHPDSRRTTTSVGSAADRNIYEWDTSGALLRKIPFLTPQPRALGADVWYSPDGEKMILFSPMADAITPGYFNVRDVNADTILYHKNLESIPVDAMFADEGRKLLVSEARGDFTIFDVATGTPLFEVGGVGGPDVRVSQDGLWLAAVIPYPNILSVTAGAYASKWENMDLEQTGGVSRADFTPDSRAMIIALEDASIAVYDLATRRRLDTLYGHTGGLNDISFSPDGSLMLTSSIDSTIRIWRVGATSLPLDTNDTPWSIVAPSSIRQHESPLSPTIDILLADRSLSPSAIDARIRISRAGALHLSVVDLTGKVLYRSVEQAEAGTVARIIEYGGPAQGHFFLVAEIDGRRAVKVITR